ncbi:YitT family protein [Shimia abyssi]|uniref:Putative 5xTM membrane YitT family protein n=1 Tax=Shimia abyssi TaxID=1662395 RepID=A0A2P8FC53_9RHOB|nr:YitT family protein [Shimia abyssi]PSL19305.1 putative 5xTM membrane YitT family protein [Shimia abyssi]
MVSFLEPPHAERHSAFEDFQGIVVGTVLMALCVQFLQASGLITGQIAGLSLTLSYASGIGFAAVFFVLNLPFYVIALIRMGYRFTLKTFAAVGLMSLWTYLLPSVMRIETLHPLAGAVLAGITAGAGLIVLFRHGATLGGVGIVAMWLQDSKGIKAGWVQLGFDLCVFALAASLFDAATVAYSLAGAAITNIMIATNHRRDRYIAR